MSRRRSWLENVRLQEFGIGNSVYILFARTMFSAWLVSWTKLARAHNCILHSITFIPLRFSLFHELGEAFISFEIIEIYLSSQNEFHPDTYCTHLTQTLHLSDSVLAENSSVEHLSNYRECRKTPRIS